MAKRGGFGGGMPANMNNLMKQAQKMQRQMEEAKKSLDEREYTAKAGGGVVEVKISGKKELLSVKLAEEVVDPDDIEMLEDLIVAAVNEAMRAVDEDAAKTMGQFTGGLPF
ncbi:MAG: YbaB/EbfC family nucleoid-associated protein [Lachnospiraceae bacterium]|nr:YbaB/EbfC family nucleoid-associated protein [Lachnospiraceae bacterium]